MNSRSEQGSVVVFVSPSRSIFVLVRQVVIDRKVGVLSTVVVDLEVDRGGSTQHVGRRQIRGDRTQCRRDGLDVKDESLCGAVPEEVSGLDGHVVVTQNGGCPNDLSGPGIDRESRRKTGRGKTVRAFGTLDGKVYGGRFVHCVSISVIVQGIELVLGQHLVVNPEIIDFPVEGSVDVLMGSPYTHS